MYSSKKEGELSSGSEGKGKGKVLLQALPSGKPLTGIPLARCCLPHTLSVVLTAHGDDFATAGCKPRPPSPMCTGLLAAAEGACSRRRGEGEGVRIRTCERPPSLGCRPALEHALHQHPDHTVAPAHSTELAAEPAAPTSQLSAQMQQTVQSSTRYAPSRVCRWSKLGTCKARPPAEYRRLAAWHCAARPALCALTTIAPGPAKKGSQAARLLRARPPASISRSSTSEFAATQFETSILPESGPRRPRTRASPRTHEAAHEKVQGCRRGSVQRRLMVIPPHSYSRGYKCTSSLTPRLLLSPPAYLLLLLVPIAPACVCLASAASFWSSRCRGRSTQ